ncbi:MAG: hypothetical protein HGA44_01125 [Cellulomonadaceae bacterium]|nr:hypothetical protein [Cellulomonadaceae bacterium]
MTDISVSREGMEEGFARVLPLIDDIDTALGAVPVAPDGGVATELIGFVMAASLEAAGVAADSYRALIAISRDVMDDFASNDSRAAEELRELKRHVEGNS